MIQLASMKRAVASAAGMVTPSSDEASAQVGEPSATDAMWAAMMIPHHQTGIQMAEMAASKATTEALRQAAASSKVEQEEDIPQLEQIVRAAGKTTMPPEKQIERMNKQHMQVLQSLSGVDFDRHWITVVSGHHMSAIMMTDTAMAGRASPAAGELQKKLRDDQLQELEVLNDLHEQLNS
jgi:uncharacterized protein (DUF305 family)